MTLAKWVSGLGIIAMVAVLLQGFIIGSFFEDGGVLLRNPWGLVSVVDLYVGFILFSLWIGFREASKVSALLWIIGMMVFGFLTGAIYVFVLCHKHKSWEAFFLGRHHAQTNEER